MRNILNHSYIEIDGVGSFSLLYRYIFECTTDSTTIFSIYNLFNILVGINIKEIFLPLSPQPRTKYNVVLSTPIQYNVIPSGTPRFLQSYGSVQLLIILELIKTNIFDSSVNKEEREGRQKAREVINT